MKGFNAGLIKCEQGELNPIIFAAQTNQRFVSFHPFENGKGRIPRLLMDYVLERFNLPSPDLGSNVLDAVFPMDPLKTNQEKFITKIINEMEGSRRILATI